MSMFGMGQRARKSIRPRPRDESMLPMEDIALDTPAPVNTARYGQFGADKLPRNEGMKWAAFLNDAGDALSGGPMTGLDDFYAGEQAAQQAADWTAELDGLDLAPEIRTFAEQDPEAFRKMQFEEAQGRKTRADLSAQLDALNLPPEVRRMADMNPAGFLEQAGKDAGKTQTDTHYNPLTGWNRQPIMGQNGDSLFEWDGVGDPTFKQRPQAYDEAETARNNLAEEELTSRELDIRDRNARTAEINAGRPAPAGRGRGALVDEPTAPIPGEAPIRYQTPDGGMIEGFNGGRLIRVGIGADGKYAPTEGDPEIPQGKRFPPPSFSTVEGLGDKAGPNINAENKIMSAITATKDAAVNLKSISDKYITDSEGYPFGSMPWDGVRQWADPRTEGLRGLNAKMALEIGKMAKGAMSDADREWFIKAAPNERGKPESNAVFAMQANAVANNANQYNAFMQAYRSEYGNGSIAEAQRYWDMYSLANPVFDDNGDAVEGRMGYQEFFTGTPAKRQDVFERDYPGVRGNKGGGLSAAQRQELEELERMEAEGRL